MRTTIFAVLLLVSSGAHAAGWSVPLTVERGYTENSDDIVLYTSGGNGAYASGCLSHAWVFVANSETRRGRAWATILTALTTGQRIQLWYTDTCASYSYHSAATIMLLGPGS